MRRHKLVVILDLPDDDQTEEVVVKEVVEWWVRRGIEEGNSTTGIAWPPSGKKDGDPMANVTVRHVASWHDERGSEVAMAKVKVAAEFMVETETEASAMEAASILMDKMKEQPNMLVNQLLHTFQGRNQNWVEFNGGTLVVTFEGGHSEIVNE